MSLSSFLVDRIVARPDMVLFTWTYMGLRSKLLWFYLNKKKNFKNDKTFFQFVTYAVDSFNFNGWSEKIFSYVNEHNQKRNHWEYDPKVEYDWSA